MTVHVSNIDNRFVEDNEGHQVYGPVDPQHALGFIAGVEYSSARANATPRHRSLVVEIIAGHTPAKFRVKTVKNYLAVQPKQVLGKPELQTMIDQGIEVVVR